MFEFKLPVSELGPATFYLPPAAGRLLLPSTASDWGQNSALGSGMLTRPCARALCSDCPRVRPRARPHAAHMSAHPRVNTFVGHVYTSAYSRAYFLDFMLHMF